MANKNKKADTEKPIENETTVIDEAIAEEAVQPETADEIQSEESDNGDRIKELEAELASQKDQFLRLAAEYANYRNRTQKEREGLFNDAKVETLKPFLTFADNFDRAMEGECDAENFKSGITMIYRQWKESFKKLGIEEFGEEGEEFNPELHYAVMHCEDEDKPDNTVTKILVKGYRLGDRIIRPAMVEAK